MVDTHRAADVRAELDAAIVRFEDTRTGPGPSGRFEGTLVAGPALVGPPGRVHGGLHPVVRLLAPLARVGHGFELPAPMELDLTLGRALPLRAPVPFEGVYETTAEGSRISTRFAGTERLDASASAVARAAAVPALEPWRDALDEDFASPPLHVFRVRDTVPVRAGARLLAIELDERFWSVPGNDLARYRATDGSVDAAFITVALDLVGACVAGFEWDARLFTTRFRVVLLDLPPADAGPLLALGDRRRMAPHPGSSLPLRDVRGTPRPEVDVPVLFADRGLDRAFAHGVLTFYPRADDA